MEPNPAALSPHTKHNTQVKISKQTLICLRGNSRSCSGWRLARQMVTYLMSPGQVPTSPPDRHSRQIQGLLIKPRHSRGTSDMAIKRETAGHWRCEVQRGVEERCVCLEHTCLATIQTVSANRNNDVGNREHLAVKLALEEWRHWLEGAKEPFFILTDHLNLEYIRTARRLKPRQARWALFFTRLVVPGPLTDAVPHNTPPPPWTSRGDRRTLSDPYWTPDVVGPPPVSGGLGGVWPRGVLGSSGRHSGFQHHW
ncbi:uncharacterized protein LOC127907463 isoform X1 [Oncorhynchus keta]|uniref:uncharacterized protein LOC127907463 isoform X1 n=1 Tax=Oncorhynchus keta TaxID=8018 RepID=UPI00227AB1A9|nr:uncharacterized protein LOC127907463 isoform X1 [Oncorhynchus keta]